MAPPRPWPAAPWGGCSGLPTPGRKGRPRPDRTRVGVGAASLLVGVALLLPGIGDVVVAVALPEAAHVVVEELEAAQPLGALPEVALRDEQTERVAVLRVERPPVVRVGE